MSGEILSRNLLFKGSGYADGTFCKFYFRETTNEKRDKIKGGVPLTSVRGTSSFKEEILKEFLLFLLNFHLLFPLSPFSVC